MHGRRVKITNKEYSKILGCMQRVLNDIENPRQCLLSNPLPSFGFYKRSLLGV
jgi:hypothetical protein